MANKEKEVKVDQEKRYSLVGPLHLHGSVF